MPAASATPRQTAAAFEQHQQPSDAKDDIERYRPSSDSSRPLPMPAASGSPTSNIGRPLTTPAAARRHGRQRALLHCQRRQQRAARVGVKHTPPPPQRLQRPGAIARDERRSPAKRQLPGANTDGKRSPPTSARRRRPPMLAASIKATQNIGHLLTKPAPAQRQRPRRALPRHIASARHQHRPQAPPPIQRQLLSATKTDAKSHSSKNASSRPSPEPAARATTTLTPAPAGRRSWWQPPAPHRNARHSDLKKRPRNVKAGSEHQLHATQRHHPAEQRPPSANASGKSEPARQTAPTRHHSKANYHQHSRRAPAPCKLQQPPAKANSRTPPMPVVCVIATPKKAARRQTRHPPDGQAGGERHPAINTRKRRPPAATHGAIQPSLVAGGSKYRRRGPLPRQRHQWLATNAAGKRRSPAKQQPPRANSNAKALPPRGSASSRPSPTPAASVTPTPTGDSPLKTAAATSRQNGRQAPPPCPQPQPPAANAREESRPAAKRGRRGCTPAPSATAPQLTDAVCRPPSPASPRRRRCQRRARRRRRSTRGPRPPPRPAGPRRPPHRHPPPANRRSRRAPPVAPR